MEAEPAPNPPRTIGVSEARWRAFKAAAIHRGFSLTDFLAYLLDKAESNGEYERPSPIA